MKMNKIIRDTHITVLYIYIYTEILGLTTNFYILNQFNWVYNLSKCFENNEPISSGKCYIVYFIASASIAYEVQISQWNS